MTESSKVTFDYKRWKETCNHLATIFLCHLDEVLHKKPFQISVSIKLMFVKVQQSSKRSLYIITALLGKHSPQSSTSFFRSFRLKGARKTG